MGAGPRLFGSVRIYCTEYTAAFCTLLSDYNDILFMKEELAEQLEDTVNQRFDTLLVSHVYCSGDLDTII